MTPTTRTLIPLIAASDDTALGTVVDPTRRHERDKLLARFADRVVVNHDLTRSMVSWQSNKNTPGFRWFKYKEGFSTSLVDYLLRCLNGHGLLLDPFAGTCAAPITAAKSGWTGLGMELLPVCATIVNALIASQSADLAHFKKSSASLLDCLTKTHTADELTDNRFPHIRITQNAFSESVEREIAIVRKWLQFAESGPETELLILAAISALEDASWTSKDGQYLRWDHRSGRRLKAKMEKRCVLSYEESLRKRLHDVEVDLPSLSSSFASDSVHVLHGSCYDALPTMPKDSVDAVITSPPYANRYDYTRTYALELAWLGFSDNDVSALRQSLLSATVENRSKREQLEPTHSSALALFDQHPAITEVVNVLEEANDRGELPNPHVVRLVKNYCMEMTVVIRELSRVCRPGSSVFMVNDNVQYHGEEIPLDLILSDLAEQCGFRTKVIWQLARGKGNASQQMGRFGRKELRKCVYWWERR